MIGPFMRIGFSTFVMQGGQSGIGTYIRNLVRFLQEEDLHNDYDLLMAQADADLITLTNPAFSKRIYPARSALTRPWSVRRLRIEDSVPALRDDLQLDPLRR